MYVNYDLASCFVRFLSLCSSFSVHSIIISTIRTRGRTTHCLRLVECNPWVLTDFSRG